MIICLDTSEFTMKLVRLLREHLEKSGEKNEGEVVLIGLAEEKLLEARKIFIVGQAALENQKRFQESILALFRKSIIIESHLYFVLSDCNEDCPWSAFVTHELPAYLKDVSVHYPTDPTYAQIKIEFVPESEKQIKVFGINSDQSDQRKELCSGDGSDFLQYLESAQHTNVLRPR